ncbi:MAG: ribosomal protein S18-alanine N-acetyltransferase [Dorea sp.]|jgi:ribosomal-protein-alanine N-acetyltransferase|nr:ribosomal protein S18-alanine N-acetyltransferase [Dorea sp.]
MTFDIKNIEQKDIEKIHQLEKKYFPDPWSIAGIQESLAQTYTALLGAWEGEKLAGYVIAYFSVDGGEIARIAVDEPYRRKGAALKLLDVIKETGRKMQAEKIMLDVRESNEEAVRLYKKFGFTEDGVRKNYYVKPKENAVLMSFAIGK